MRRLLIGLALLIVLPAATLAAIWSLTPPSHDRDWQPVYGRVAQVRETGAGHVLGNVRNWSYAADGTPTAQDWIEVAIDPERLSRIWFVVEPFGDTPAVAHTMLSFEFEDGSAYVASVEARREVGETYQPIRAALLPTMEFLWIWSTERDAYANSTWFTNDELRLYALNLTPEEARAVLRQMLAETADVAAHPRWYNTLFSNCTNVLARAVNRIRPDAVPWDIAWNLPGYADAFLARQGLIAAPDGIEVARARARITPLVPEAYSETDPAAFSRRLRDLLAAD